MGYMITLGGDEMQDKIHDSKISRSNMVFLILLIIFVILFIVVTGYFFLIGEGDEIINTSNSLFSYIGFSVFFIFILLMSIRDFTLTFCIYTNGVSPPQSIFERRKENNIIILFEDIEKYEATDNNEWCKLYLKNGQRIIYKGGRLPKNSVKILCDVLQKRGVSIMGN